MCIFLIDVFVCATVNGYTEDAQVCFNFTIFHEAQKPKAKELKSRSRTE